MLRNGQNRGKKNLKKKLKKKKGTYLPRFSSGHLPDIRRFQFLFLWRPLIQIQGIQKYTRCVLIQGPPAHRPVFFLAFF
jgi:hypothetical protein